MKNIFKNWTIGKTFGIIGVVIVALIIKWLWWLTSAPWGLQFGGTWTVIIIMASLLVILFRGITKDPNDYVFEDASAKWHFAMIGTPVIGFIILIIVCFVNGEFMSGNERWEYVASMVTEITDETASEGNAFPNLMPNGDTSNLPMYGEYEAYKKVEVLMSSQESIGSQFEIGTDFTSQSINGELCYVEELEPISMFRWDSSIGNAGYYTVDRNTGEAKYYNINLKTTQNAPFGDKAIRILRKRYPNIGIMDLTPEVDDDGNFYYVATTYTQDAPNALRKVSGVIVLNAVTLEDTKYSIDEIPDWIDRVYPEEIFEEYINVYGKYAGGRKNSIIGKKGLEQQTNDMEVVYIDGICYYYSGWTSIGRDGASNGIIMMNSRTGEITLYRTSGINEDKAMQVAEGKVKAYEYTASYPILLMVSGHETYFMLMHDSNKNLVGYAFVSYKDYTKAAVADTLYEAQALYIKSWAEENSSGTLNDDVYETAKGVITGIASEVVDGNTIYYVTINNEEQIYSMTSSLAVTIVFAKEDDYIEIKYIPANTECINAIEVIHTRTRN